MPIIAMAIDSVFRPQMVYGFAARRPQPAHGLAGLRWTKRSCRCSPTSPALRPLRALERFRESLWTSSPYARAAVGKVSGR